MVVSQVVPDTGKVKVEIRNPSMRSLFWTSFFAFCLLFPMGCSTSTEPEKNAKTERANETKAMPRRNGSPASYDSILKEAETAFRSGDSELALQKLQEIPVAAAEAGRTAAYMKAAVYQSMGKYSEAYDALDAMLSIYPRERLAHQQAATLLAMSGLRSEAEKHLKALSKLGDLAFEESVLLTDFDRRHPRYAPMLEDAADKSPADPLVQLGLAMEEFNAGKFEAARQRLKSVSALNTVGQALLGEVLVELDSEQLTEWYEQLSDDSLKSWEIRFALGRWCRSKGDNKTAARCFWDCLQQNQTSYRIWFNLAAVLTDLNASEANAYRIQADRVFQVRSALSLVLNSGGSDLSAVRKLIETLHALGRYNDELIWLKLASRRHPGNQWIHSQLQSLRRERPSTSVDKEMQLTLRELPSLDHFPAFSGPPGSVNGQSELTLNISKDSAIAFEEQSSALGVNFSFNIGRPVNVRDVRMFESTGGGIGIIDIDGDSLPDMFLSQGLHWPSAADQPSGSAEFTDRLYRNRTTVFDDISLVSNVSMEMAYGQGCAVGDINDDGFADLYVANIGLNRLLINNGDGTFTDAALESGLQSESWTTSCLIADIDGDLNADLYDVNYLQGVRVFRDSCSEHGCSTAPFDGAADVVAWSNGNGQFRFVQRSDEGTNGPGLGIAAFREWGSELEDSVAREIQRDSRETEISDVSSAPELSLFVGNDGKPDYLLRLAHGTSERSEATGVGASLVDTGFLRGVAVNSSGKYTSSMGIATGDLNLDGRLDFLVTNYSAEANSLFIQQPGGFFTDRIDETAIKLPGIPYIGWGTQFLDMNCDGLLDIFIANGHVADFQEPGTEYAMPAHVFMQTPGFHFHLLDSVRLGPYFETPVLGRAAALVDWNCDGRQDLVVGAIGSPTTILTNMTSADCHSIGFRLHASRSARDAIGAVVTVTCGELVRACQLTGGNGFHSCNEKILHFGLGPSTATTCSATINWPSGHIDELTDIPLDVTVDIREGLPSYWVGGRNGNMVTRKSSNTSHRPLTLNSQQRPKKPNQSPTTTTSVNPFTSTR